MDKEILALIGKLYVEIYTLSNFSETLKAKIKELEAQLESFKQKETSTKK